MGYASQQFRTVLGFAAQCLCDRCTPTAHSKTQADQELYRNEHP
jgi:hypothetical protein